MKTSKRIIASLLCATMLLVSACGNGGQTTNSESEILQNNENDSSDTQAVGDDDVIVIGVASDLKTLDPGNCYEVFANMVLYGLYDNLFKFEGSDVSNPQPCLISDYTVNEDNTEYVFTLKDGLKFASGNPITSEDVKFSFNRTKNIKGNMSHTAEGIKSIETPDDQTVVLTLSEPDGSFLTKLASNAFCVLDSAVLKENGGSDAEDASSADIARAYLDANSAGSGPYVLSSWTQNVEVVLDRNDNYWGEPAKASRIIFKEIPDANTQIQMLQKGEIDVALSLGADHLDQLEGQDGVTVVAPLSMTTTFLMMNEDETIGGPLANADVQQAIRYAINYSDLQILSGENSVTPLSNVPQGFVGAEERPSDYTNIEKAKELLVKAGYPDGFTTKMTVANYSSEGTQWTTMAQKIKDDLSKVNINVEIETGEIGVVIDSYRQGKAEFLFMHWAPDYYDINNQLAFLPGMTVGERANWAKTANPELTALGDKISVELDAEKRAADSKAMQDIMAESSPYAFLIQHPKVVAYRSDLAGVEYNDLCKIQLATLEHTAN